MKKHEAKLTKVAEKLVDSFADAAMTHGWESDQGSAPYHAKLTFETSKAELKAYILRLQSSNKALDKKLEAYRAVSQAYADAIRHAQPGAWTPQVQMGAGAGGSGSAATTLVDMLTAKTASELGLDRTVTRGASAKK